MLYDGGSHPLLIKDDFRISQRKRFQRYRLNKITENKIMLKRFAQTFVLIILVSYLCSDEAIAQTRRSKSRRARPSRQNAAGNNIQPLTESQRAAVAALIEEGKRVEYKINYARSEFADSAMMMASCDGVKKSLPDGNIKNLSIRLCQEYEDAGQVYGRVTKTGAINRLEETISRNNPEADSLPLTIQRYGLQRVTPFQAVNIILNIAIKDREFLQGILYAAPIIPEPVVDTSIPESVVTTPAPPRTTIYDTAMTPKREAETNALVGDWTLQISAPNNQRLILTLIIKQENGKLNCTVEGNDDQMPCTATANSFTFTIPNVPLQGEMYNMDLVGSAEADNIKGKMTFTNRNGLSISLPITGTRTKQ
jgi:hypothetical protein